MTEDDPRGVQSASTNHLEKAYEDLEKEIQDLKHKLQQSVGLGSSQGHSQLVQSQPARAFGQSQGSQPLKYQSQSPARTFGQGGTEGQMDDDDYSLSVSDLNQSHGHRM